MLKKLDVAGAARERGSAISGRTTSDSLTTLINVVDFYEAKIGQTRSANQALRTVAHEIDRDGLQGVEEGRDVEIRSWVELFVFLLLVYQSDVSRLEPLWMRSLVC